MLTLEIKSFCFRWSRTSGPNFVILRPFENFFFIFVLGCVRRRSRIWFTRSRVISGTGNLPGFSNPSESSRPWSSEALFAFQLSSFAFAAERASVHAAGADPCPPPGGLGHTQPARVDLAGSGAAPPLAAGPAWLPAPDRDARPPARLARGHVVGGDSWPAAPIPAAGGAART